MKVRRRGKEGGLETHGFSVDVESQICPVSIMHTTPQLRELVDLQLRHENAGIELFSKVLPAWAVDFKQIIAVADKQIDRASEEKLASL